MDATSIPPPGVEENLNFFLRNEEVSHRLLTMGQIRCCEVREIKNGDADLRFVSRTVGAMGAELAGLLVSQGAEAGVTLKYRGHVLPGVDGVILCGGGVVGATGIVDPDRVRRAPDDGFFSVSALEWPCGMQAEVLALDMGKSFLKVGFCGIFRRFARNFDKFPWRKTPQRQRRRRQGELAAFVGRKLSAVVREAGIQPKALMVGFPCEVSVEGIPLYDAYPGMRGWKDAGQQFAACAGLGTCQVWVCNDAELAAWSALRSPISKEWSQFAVITVGTALGLALVCREGWTEI